MNKIIPPPYPEPFIGAIAHPNLYLWDCWSYQEDKIQHLYCLAVSRYDADGLILDPSLRNQRPFHVRHFVSTDNAVTWLDAGCFQEPRIGGGDFDSRSIWSGSIAALRDGRKLVAYTGIKECGETRAFQQSMGIAVTLDGAVIEPNSEQLISCCYRDWQDIIDHGYFLGDRESLGRKDGEQGGPIMAWRDPFVLVHQEEIYMFWAAKLDSSTSALGHAKLVETADGFAMGVLYPPIVMPDAQIYTQLELPKIIYDDVGAQWYLIISTCNRLYEGQADAEVDKQIRLYKSNSMAGPWLPFYDEDSLLKLDEQNMFGLTVIDTDFERKVLCCISPFTEDAPAEKSLTLSASFSVHLDNVDGGGDADN